jgi:hypothetical protein
LPDRSDGDFVHDVAIMNIAEIEISAYPIDVMWRHGTH